MAAYSMTTGAPTSYYGGGFGSDLAGFAHSAYAGMNNGMQFANNYYDLQRRAALAPYEQNQAISAYDANTHQNELAANKAFEDRLNAEWSQTHTMGYNANDLTAANGNRAPQTASVVGGATNPTGTTTAGTPTAAPAVGVVQPATQPQAYYVPQGVQIGAQQPIQPQVYGTANSTQVTLPQAQPYFAPAATQSPVLNDTATQVAPQSQFALNNWVNGAYYG